MEVNTEMEANTNMEIDDTEAEMTPLLPESKDLAGDI